MKEKIGRALLSFFILMICCTLVARAADSVTLARVQTSACKSGSLSHTFSGSGTLQPKSRTYQFLPAGQKVALVLAKPGTEVEAGTPLVQLDPDYLNDQIRDQERAIQKLKLTLEQQRLNGQTAARLPVTAQAELSLDSTREARNRAREELKKAQEAYQKFLEEQEANVGTQKPDTPDPGAQQPDTPDSGAQQPDTPDPGVQQPDTPDGTDVKTDSQTPGGTEPKTDSQMPGEGEQKPNSQAPGGTDSPQSSDPAPISDSQTSAPDAQVPAEEASLPQTAKQHMPALGSQAPEQPTTEQSSQAPGQPSSSLEEQRQALEEQKQALEQQISAAQAQLDSAQDLYDQAKASYRLAEQEEANTQSNESRQEKSSRLTLQGLQLDLEEAQEDLEKLTAIQNAEGIVSAQVSGTLESLGASEGTLTSGTETIILASPELEACGSIPAQEIGRISAGDTVEALFSGVSKSAALTVERLETDTEGNLVWYAPYAGKNGRGGLPFTYEFNQTSHTIYEQLIPLTALYESAGSTYVLTAELRTGILGDSYTAVPVTVTVLEKDANHAAIQTSLPRDSKIITSSNKYVKGGDRIRLDD